MAFIQWLDKVSKDDVDIVGIKGANLGELFQQRLPVPFGFVLTSDAFDLFLGTKNLEEKIINLQNSQSLIEASVKIKELFLENEIPAAIKKEIVDAYNSLSVSNSITDKKVLELISVGRDPALVAVRRSLIGNFFDHTNKHQVAFLNIKGREDLLLSIKKCWLAQFESTNFLNFISQRNQGLSVAVIIQKMVNSEKSGIILASNNKTVIRATWGFGETLSLGKVSPDVYTISNSNQLDVKVASKERMTIRDYATDRTIEIPVPKDKAVEQVLNEEEVFKLVNIGNSIEKYFRKPQEIEFAIHLGKIYITQAKELKK